MALNEESCMRDQAIRDAELVHYASGYDDMATFLRSSANQRPLSPVDRVCVAAGALCARYGEALLGSTPSMMTAAEDIALRAILPKLNPEVPPSEA